jgi:DNA-binding transcriptional ArsR family regulator
MVARPVAPVSVALEPVVNALQSIFLLVKAVELSGLDPWVEVTLARMTAAERARNRLVMVGLYYAVMPERSSWSDFPAYVNHLQKLPATELRDKLLAGYECMSPHGAKQGQGRAGREETTMAGLLDSADATLSLLEQRLASADAYLSFLRERFTPDHIDEALEREAYRYVADPAALQDLIVSHLRLMWDRYLRKEWQRVEPMLRDAVAAFGEANLTSMDKVEAIRLVTGREVEEQPWLAKVAASDRIVFVPSAHVGPYLWPLKIGGVTYVIFGARLPEGVPYHAPDLSRAEIVVRLGALADDTRLGILRMIAEDGELRSQDVIERLDLSQSAASRHLKQLSAAGFLLERRCNGAKCYRLNGERLEKTLQAVAGFLLQP